MTYGKSTDQPVKVANPARGRSNCPGSHLRIWYYEKSSAIPSRVSLLMSIVRLNLVLPYGIPPEFSDGVLLFLRPTGQSRVYKVASAQVQYSNVAPVTGESFSDTVPRWTNFLCASYY